QLHCASCDAGERTFKAEIPTSSTYELIGVYRLPQWVGDDGSVYFTTSAGLVPTDVNGVDDVYAYKEGRQQLISSGDANYSALFMDIGDGGRDIYFLTNQPLVAQDTNRASDIYDARVGGGFVVQNEVPSPACLGESCQLPASGPPAANSAGSEAIPPASKMKAKKHPKKKAKSRGCKQKIKRKRGAAPTQSKKSCQKAKHAGSKNQHGRNGR
ncbi:MAG TPA: hypothetical protein VMF55_07150, partial [Solirubrobacterales bacterium]|nr:hypothetical protein [Solirubrobacterales bacterium]